MRDTELYRAILGLTPPWTVGSVELGLPAGQVIVRVDAGAGPFACPECGRAAERYDRRSRRWRPFDTWQLTTWIEAPGPRIDCAPHGVKQIRVPWAEPGSPFRGLFERLPIDLPGECSVTGATRVLRISWDEAWASRPAPSAGGWPGGRWRSCPIWAWTRRPSPSGTGISRVVADLARHRVLYLADDRKQARADHRLPLDYD